MANLRVKQAAEYVGLSKSYLDKARCYGSGPAYMKLGASVIYSTDDLDAWLEGQKRTQVYGFEANDNRPARKRRAAA